MKKLLLCLIVCGGCASTQPKFFGGAIVSNYVDLFDGQVNCAFVDGWSVPGDVGCMCTINDPSSPDKTFLRVENSICNLKKGK